MTCSDPSASPADTVLDQLTALLSAERIAEHVDRPIDRAIDSFRGTWETPFVVRQFHNVLGAFVRHVYSQCGYCTALLQATSAQAEAIQLLQAGYQGAFESGYDGALLDVVHTPEPPRQGIETVLLGLGAIIKAKRRQDYMVWLMHRHIDPLDHRLQRGLVLAVQNRHRACLPEDLASCAPYELVGQIEPMLQMLLDVEAAIPTRPAPTPEEAT